MYIHGFGIGGYRSFGAELQKVAPLRKVNLIVGQNNSGKSNLLRFAHHHLAEVLGRAKGEKKGALGFSELDRHLPGPVPFQFAVGFSPSTGPVLATLSEGKYGHLAEEILGLLVEDDGLAWIRFRANALDNALKLQVEELWLAEVIGRGRRLKINWTALNRNWTGGFWSDAERDAAQVLAHIAEVTPPIPAVSLLPAIRQIGTSELTSDDYSGSDIIRRLANLQHPSIHEQQKKQQFRALNDFVRGVLDDVTAEIEVPDQKDTLHIKIGKTILPLESLGTGIHEVTMLGAWATTLENQIVCIEEPELHLHPILQKKLLNYLSNQTSNQYLITTHSAHLLDDEGATILHVRWNQENSAVERASSTSHRVQICEDLGYRPSDLLQANSVIWVEGPSDRLYIQHWLADLAPEFIEGVHYSLMFYGGRLLSHLSADDIEINEFIDLRTINRHLSIVIDSDRSKKGQPMNATKRRVRDEFDKGPGFAWVTQGREIENYLPPTLLLDSLKSFRPDAVRLESEGRYDKIYRFERHRKVEAADKVKLAHAVTSRPADFSIMDLRAQILALAAFIARSNGLGAPDGRYSSVSVR